MKAFDLLDISAQKRNKTQQKRRALHSGLDTETYHGYCNLLTVSFSDEKNDFVFIPFSTDYDNTQKLKLILEFLSSKRFQGRLNWFYNINYDFRAIIKYLPLDKLNQLYSDNKVSFEGYEIQFLSHKYFSVKKQKHTNYFYDIAQFFTGGLNKNAQKYLNDKKIDKIDSSILGENKEYWINNINDVIKYCIYDSDLTRRLAEFFYSNLWNEIQFNPKKPYSAGSISQEFFINNARIPILSDNIPTEVLKLHQDSYRGGRIEVLKKGFFDNLYSYDIKSAYPAIMTTLLDYTKGRWIETDNLLPEYHGIYYVKYEWFNDNIGAFAQNYYNVTVYPNSLKSYYILNEKELLFLEKHGCDYKILKGYAFVPSMIIYPYKDLILELFNQKEGTKDENKRMVYKLFINSIYGKTAQAIYDKKTGKFKTGSLYNPIYCNRITALTRLKLLENSLDIAENIIGFSTDSIMTLKPIKNVGNNLGDFTFEYNSKDNVVLLSGIRYTDSKQKMRGFTNNLDLKKILLDNPDKNQIVIDIPKPVTLFQSIAFNKYSKDDMNVFIPEKKILDINGDRRRIWFDDFKNCKDVFDRYIESTPFTI